MQKTVEDADRNHMELFEKIIEEEERRVTEIVEEMHATLANEEADRRDKAQEMAALRRQKLDATGWREKREIDELIERCRQRYAMRHYQDSGVLIQPYFGILELEDDDLGPLSHCLGRRSFFDRKGRVLVIDWREAPISRLFYEYDAGELYEEEIRGRDRSGTVRTKRQVDTMGGRLRKILEKGIMLARRDDGSWHSSAGSSEAVSRKEEKADHRLPEITALISREQFQAITRPESSTVLLQGGAGSGKTTVGLHRIAYLAYQEPNRFKPHRILVVMFNRSLQRYMSLVLPELGIPPGVQVETYHSWAGKVFRKAGVAVSYCREEPPAEVTRLKKHPVMLSLADRYLDGLLKKSCNWLLLQLHKNGDPDLVDIRARLEGLPDFEQFLRHLNTHPDFLDEAKPQARRRLRMRLLKRFNDHTADLRALLGDRSLLQDGLAAYSVRDPKALERLLEWQARLQSQNRIDFADTGLLLLLMQRKGVPFARPGYAHVMADEAQDLAEVELATLMGAADERQSITICGDMAQKIKDDVSFDHPDGFAGFVRSRQQRADPGGRLCAETLVVGYRATRPIMELAWHVLGERPSMAVARDGDPVRIMRLENHEATVEKAAEILEDYLARRPKALVAVICRFKSDADRVFEDLKARGLLCVRRHARDDFSFKPGIIVTNVHQVKGLEFSAALIFNPGVNHYRDDTENRMLLHVALTRAADHLWVVGHHPLAFQMETWDSAASEVCEGTPPLDCGRHEK